MTSNPLITAPAHFSPRHVAHLHRRIVFWLRGALEARMGNAPVEVNRVSALIMDAMMLVWSDVLRLAVDVEDVGAMPCDQCIAFDVFPERALPPAPGTTRRRRRGSGDDNAIAVQYYGETTGGEGVSSKSKSNSKGMLEWPLHATHLTIFIIIIIPRTAQCSESE